MFFKFPIRTIVQEEHGGTSLPYNNIQHGMYSLYKVMNRADANRESLLPYAQAPMKKKSTENAAPMSARIIRKTKCFDFWERNVLFPKTKRSFFRTPTLPFSA